MRTAIISDIHGHYRRLVTALADIEGRQCHRIICLGDLVDGGEDDEQTVEEIRARNIPCVRGNHDVYHNVLLDEQVEDYLFRLPDDIVEGDILFTHISPRKRKYYIKNEFEAWNAFDECTYRIVFIGHNHFSIIFGEKCEESVSATRIEFSYNRACKLDTKNRYIISVGAVGYSRDGLSQASTSSSPICYGIYDSDVDSIEIRTVDFASSI